MPKNNFENDSIFNEGVNNRSPLQKLADIEIPGVNSMNETPLKSGKDVNLMSSTKIKSTVDVYSMSDTPNKIGQNISSLSSTPTKTTIEVNTLGDTPTKVGKNINSVTNTPIKEGVDVNDMKSVKSKSTIDINSISDTPPKSTVKINDMEGTPPKSTVNINSFSTSNLESTSNISPNNLNSIKPFQKLSLSSLENYSPNGLDNINNSSNIGGLHGGTESSTIGAQPPHPDDHSSLDDLMYNKGNKYEDSMNSVLNGMFPDKYENLSNNTTNPLVINHSSDLGKMGQHIPQEVDFQNEQYGGFEHLPPNPFPEGFTQFPILKHTLFGSNNFSGDESLSIFGGNNNYRTFPLSNSNQFTYDPRSPGRINIPSNTVSGIQNINGYNGSALNNIEIDNNFSIEKMYLEPGIGLNGFPFTEVTDGDIINKFDEYNYSPTYPVGGIRSIFENLSIGQKNIKHYNIPHTYQGSTLDEISDMEVGTNSLEDYELTSFDYRTTYEVDGLSSIPTQLGSNGQSSIFFNSSNEYKGSTLDEISSFQMNPISDSENDRIKHQEYVGNITDAPYTNVPSLEGGEIPEINDNKYDSYNYDPRVERTVPGFGSIPSYLGSSGQTIIKFQNPKNSHMGTNYDEINIDFSPTSIEGGGEAWFNTLYYHDHRSKSDIPLQNSNTISALKSEVQISITNNRDRLFLRDGNFNPFAGWRGNEPYIVSDIADSDSWHSGGRFTNFGNRTFPLMRGVTDALRISSFILSGKGMAFLATQFILQYLNPRNKRLYNPLSLYSGIPLAGNIKFRMDRGWLLSPQNYEQTLYERVTGDISGLPGDLTDTALKAVNISADKFGLGFMGGNIFQVLGNNKDGKTDITNVAPVPFDPTLIIFKSIFNDNIGIDKNPRKHNLPMTDLANKLSESTINISSATAEIAAAEAYNNASEAELELMDDKTKEHYAGVDIDELKSRKTEYESKLKTLQGLAKTKFGNGYYDYKDIPDGNNSKSGGRRYTNVGLSKLGKGNISDNYYPQKMDKNGSASPKYSGKTGDFMTLIGFGIKNKDELSGDNGAHPNDGKLVESEENGYPVYFKDMRDGSYVIFRGYIYGLNEILSPSWNSQSFVGRSEPVWSYSSTVRDMNFTLKLAAQTKDELNMIYKKINKLTSMCYPEYKTDEINFNGMSNRLRPRSPMTKLRIGELYGSGDGNELNGFIKSLNYNFLTENIWETQKGKRVPKFVDVVIGYQVIHDSTPGLDTDNFYGFRQ